MSDFWEELEKESIEEKEENLRKKKLVEEIYADFEKRKENRRQKENAWTLNLQFVKGNQYCDMTAKGSLEEETPQFFWQQHRAFNRIAPTLDARIAKIENAIPILKVESLSGEESDEKAASLAADVLKNAFDKANIRAAIKDGILWSETCGSVFYKVFWDEHKGRVLAVDETGNLLHEGEVSVSVVPPYELFPDRLDGDFQRIRSLIHAQAVPCDYILSTFGAGIAEEDERDFCCLSDAFEGGSGERKGRALLIERYTLPTKRYKNGRLEIVAGGKLLYEGDLPYQNGEEGGRTFPFVQQNCLKQPSEFFGYSVVDRLIPVQRAYNAVRNRKHEFLNKITAGVLAVEDGSVDVDALSEEGLAPGKILVFRQGSQAPQMMSIGELPSDFSKEEEWLEKEFAAVSGVSDLSQNSTPTTVTSATGLELLLSQDDSRLTATKENLFFAVKEIARHILRLYRECAGVRQLCIFGKDGEKKAVYFSGEDISLDDIRILAEENITETERKECILSLLSAGVLTEEDGSISTENKNTILETFGLGKMKIRSN